ncbi:MAG: xylose isomerase [Sphingobacteriaceae bacterium]|jgi:hydroxypyruvate isomerase|nr:xylose isomerase [Sphingobacteriaceae bacterium]
MRRVEFIKASLVAGAALATGRSAFSQPGSAAGKTFHLNYAPHQNMFASAGASFLDQIRFMYDQGFRAIEDNGFLKRSVEEQSAIGNLLAKLGMTMGVFVIDTGNNTKVSFTTGKKEFTDNFIETVNRSVEAAKRCNARWLTFVPGNFERSLPIGIQTGNVIDLLRYGTEILEKHGLIMVLEPLSDTPELFLRHSDQTYMICRAVNSPSCKILFDIYHMQKNEGNVITSMDRCWSEIAYIQIGDNPGRKEPGTGEINYKNIFKFVHEKGYKGVMGMEHRNSKPGREGEMAVIQAYRDADNFL